MQFKTTRKTDDGKFEVDSDGSSDEAMNLSAFTITELSRLHSQIAAMLPDVAKMDLHRELATQYAVVKEFQQDVLVNPEIPANQVAQCMNVTVSALGHLIKLQESLERVETFKKMETCLIEAVAVLPEEAKVKFFEEYEAMGLDKGLF